MCQHFLRAIYTCGCVKQLPTGGQGYRPPELCVHVKYMYDLYHSQPDRPPQQFSLPAAQACPAIEANGLRPGNVFEILLKEECPLHRGLEGLNKISAQSTVDAYNKEIQLGNDTHTMIFPVYHWREIKEPVTTYGVLEGEHGTSRGVERYYKKSMTGQEVAEEFAERIRIAELIRVTNEAGHANRGFKYMNAGATLANTPCHNGTKPHHKHNRHTHTRHHEIMGFPSPPRYQTIVKGFQNLSIKQHHGSGYGSANYPPAVRHSNQNHHIMPSTPLSTPPKQINDPRTPGAPRKIKFHRAGRDGSKKSKKFTPAYVGRQRNLSTPSLSTQPTSSVVCATPSPDNQPVVSVTGPTPFETKNGKKIEVHASLDYEDANSAEVTEIPGSPSQSLTVELRRPRYASALRASKPDHRRTHSI